MQRRFWVRPAFTVERRLLQGDSNNLVKEMRLQDPDLFQEYFRMDSDTFDYLFTFVGKDITKKKNCSENSHTCSREIANLFAILGFWGLPVINLVCLQNWCKHSVQDCSRSLRGNLE